VLYGTPASWFAALGVVALGVLLAGADRPARRTVGGWLDKPADAGTDGFLALRRRSCHRGVAALGPGLLHTLVAVSIVWWPFYARDRAGRGAHAGRRPHVEAARLAGSGAGGSPAAPVPGALPAVFSPQA